MNGTNGGMPAAESWGRKDICRIAEISERQLRSWEKQGLVTPGERFEFPDLLAVKTLKRLRELRIAPKKIQRAIRSLKDRLEDVDYPLAQLRITAEGGSLTVHIGGSRMEPSTGQLLLDFDAAEIEKLKSFPARSDPLAGQNEANGRLAEQWFQRGLALEEKGGPPEEAVIAYRKAIEINPEASGALVNLGTIAFRGRRLKEAAAFYDRALKADPDYPLAHFNLGNLCDEQGDFERARMHYEHAIRLNPRYADAYFNIALLCERNNELLKAIGYWHAYLKLDSVSTWASTARRQLDKLKKTLRSK